MVNLTKYLASSGIISRRNAADAVKAGRVTVNSNTVLEPGLPVADNDIVTLDGNTVKPIASHRYIMLNKPPGYTSTHSDSHAEKTIFDLIQDNADKLDFAGRLDKMSEGMLLLSTDGKFIQRIAHPSFEVLKAYFVKTVPPLNGNAIAKIQSGVHDDGDFLKPRMVKTFQDGVIFILNEGKKREIRRLVAASSQAKITILRRIATGMLKMDNLKPGQWRELSTEELELAAIPNLSPFLNPED